MRIAYENGCEKPECREIQQKPDEMQGCYRKNVGKEAKKQGLPEPGRRREQILPKHTHTAWACAQGQNRRFYGGKQRF